MHIERDLVGIGEARQHLSRQMAVRIVDLVESGRTLKDNGLVETEVITQVSARLIVNRAALKKDHARLGPLMSAFRDLAAERRRAA